MDLYEYQGKELFRRFGIPVSDGRLATSPEEARTAAQELGGQVVVKAQVLTGGRGKAGGIKLADGPDDAESHALALLGMDINGHVVRKLWIESASDIAREYYLSLTFDRGEKKALFMFTKEGGIDIEEVDSALLREHEERLLLAAVERQREVVLARNVRRGLDPELAHDVPVDIHAENRERMRLGVVGALGELDPAGLASPAREHLGLDDDLAAELLCSSARLFG